MATGPATKKRYVIRLNDGYITSATFKCTFTANGRAAKKMKTSSEAHFLKLQIRENLGMLTELEEINI